MSFSTIIGGGALLCYIGAILLDNAGLGALAIGLTMYSLKYGCGA